MLKELFFIKTNGYNMLVSVDDSDNCRYLNETDDFPYIGDLENEDAETTIITFLNTIEDDSHWENDCTFHQIFEEFPINIIASIKKEL